MDDSLFSRFSTTSENIHLASRGNRWFGKRWYELDEFMAEDRPAVSYLGSSLSTLAYRFFGAALVVSFLIFWGRSFQLQVVRGDYFRGVAEGNRIRLERLPTARGLMFDRNGTLLVRNIPRFVLSLRPLEASSDFMEQETVRQLFTRYGIDMVLVEETLETNRRSADSFSIKEPLSHEEAMQLITETQEIPGLAVRTEMRREYAQTPSFSLSHLLGYVGKPGMADLEGRDEIEQPLSVGKTGLEASYDELLGGVNGFKQFEVDALGEEKQILAQANPQDGTALMLSLDLNLQTVIEEALARTLKANRKEKGVVVALDPRDGEIRALVSLPAFDNNLFSQGISRQAYQALESDVNHPLFNRALGGAYPSGSTIKPIFVAAALEENLITPRTTFLSTGGISVGQWSFPDWKAGGHGPTDVYRALAESVNTFFYYIGGGYHTFEGLGIEKMAAWMNRFGFGQPTGIDLVGESSGLVPTPAWKEQEKGEPWYIGDTYHFAIGQGDFTATPLQIASATATIANGGRFFTPRLVQALRANGREEKLVSLPRNAAVAKPESLAVVREGLRQAVTLGSARLLIDLPVAAAGKTGTAEWHSQRPPHAWFTGFAPFQDPELVLTVLIEEGGEGSRIAVPLAKEIFAWYFTHK